MLSDQHEHMTVSSVCESLEVVQLYSAPAPMRLACIDRVVYNR